VISVVFRLFIKVMSRLVIPQAFVGAEKSKTKSQEQKERGKSEHISTYMSDRKGVAQRAVGCGHSQDQIMKSTRISTSGSTPRGICLDQLDKMPAIKSMISCHKTSGRCSPPEALPSSNHAVRGAARTSKKPTAAGTLPVWNQFIEGVVGWVDLCSPILRQLQNLAAHIPS